MDGAARSPANTPINHSDEASEKFLANEPPRWSEGNENDDFTLATLYPLVLFCPFFIFFIARFFYFLSLFPPLFFLSLFSFFFKIFRNLFDEPIARRWDLSKHSRVESTFVLGKLDDWVFGDRDERERFEGIVNDFF